MSAREEMLARIRAALGPTPAVEPVPRAYRCAGDASSAEPPELVERFCERAAEYRAAVRRISAAALEDAIADACAEHGARRLAVTAGAPQVVAGVQLVLDDPPLTTAALDALDGALTGCRLAIADTGTLVLDGGALSGRRALTLVPDLHVCVVQTEQIHATVPDAIAALDPARSGPQPLTFVSGPSATSDIELERVEGVHGPRQLVILVVESDRP